MSGRSSILDWESLATLPACALVFLLLVFPMVSALLYVKGFLLAVILATVGIVILKTGRTGLHPTVVVWTVSLSTLGFLFVLEGCFGGAPGAGQALGVYVIWPIFYMLLIAGVRNERILLRVTRTLIIATAGIAIYS